MMSPKTPLAVFTPMLGRWGHQFVKAHMEQILPGRTAVVAMCAFRPEPPCWGVDAPVLCGQSNLPSPQHSATTEAPLLSLIPDSAKEAFHKLEQSGQVEAFFDEQGVRAVLVQWMDRSLPLIKLTRDKGLR